MPKRERESDCWRSFVCPIRLELPVEPVLAADGNVYERDYFLKWVRTCKRNDRGRVRSPLTNRDMPATCTPAPSVRRALRAMVLSGDVPDEACEAWRRELAFEPRFERARDAAHKSEDAASLLMLGKAHLQGKHGAQEDVRLTEAYWRRAALQGDAEASRGLALLYASRTFGLLDHVLSAFYLGQAVARGSEHAMHLAGRLHMDREKREAALALLRCASEAPRGDADAASRRWAEQMLEGS